MKQQALSALKKYYGYSSFRPGQWEVISHALDGHDTLVLMPTGGGKSMCYQIPAMLLNGVTLVVSPLIALMIDQVTALRANGMPAAAIHSNQDERINRDIIDRASKGGYQLIYISPERLIADFDIISNSIEVSLVAIDEAHCISQWGHDFRPVYTSLRAIKERWPDIPVMALTATADRLTRGDIAGALGLRHPYAWIGSFDRPNISLEVLPDPGKRGRLRVISDLIRKYRLDSGIVYCLSRKKTEDMHKALSDLGFRSVCYHAGMSASDREAAQKAFVDGTAQVVCATIAFGMGIDKSNIRWVVHNNLPSNIESYYQEIGRAGRDGLPAEAILFYNYGDVITRRSFAESSGQPEINNEKLDFMQRYAESTVCRRRILLSYFSEETTCDCGNCDNCRNPRGKFDGTILAQKALSAVIRINSREGISMVIDILRASNRAEIFSKRYDQIRTYGAGRDLGSRQWHNYILQMIQLGLFEVAYEDNFHLRPTPLGMKVVKGEQRIELSVFQETAYNRGRKEKAPAEKKRSQEETLLDRLKEVRKDISAKENVPAYVVFSDATLTDMVRKQPKDLDEIRQVSGVGEVKSVKYGRSFISAIRKFLGLKTGRQAGTSVKETLILFNSGMSAEEIAKTRELSVSTVCGHIAQAAENGEPVDFRRLVTDRQLTTVKREMDKDPENLFKRLEEVHGIPSHITRLAMTELRLGTEASNS